MNHEYELEEINEYNGYAGIDAQQEVRDDPEEPWVYVDNEIVIEEARNMAIPPIDEWFPQENEPVFGLVVPEYHQYYGDYENSNDLHQL